MCLFQVRNVQNPDYVTINVDNAGGLCINNVGQTNGEHGSIFFASHATSSANIKQGIGVKRNGDFGVGDMVFAVDSNADNAAVSMINDAKMVITQAGKVGIGTTSAISTAMLSVLAGSDARVMTLEAGGTGANDAILIKMVMAKLVL